MKDQSSHKSTISDVAHAAGVAEVTVSRVVNNGRYVSSAVEERVRRAIQQLGYQPNEAARMLKGKKARTIGLIVPNLADSFYAACAHAVQETATRPGYMTLIQAAAGNPEVEAREIEMMISRNVAGLILVPTKVTTSPRLIELQAAGIPIVTLDRTVKGLKASAVLVENLFGAEEAVRHLIGHGHKQIACLGYDAELLPIQQRIQGYTKAMRENRLQPQVWRAESSKSIHSLLQRNLKRSKRPTALFTLNNVTTIQTLHTLQQNGLRIPKDIALAGFDDLELSSLLAVPITVVRQSAHELGHSGAKLLFEIIEKTGNGVSPKDLPTTHLTLHVELIVRNSCGCKGIAPASEDREIVAFPFCSAGR